MQHGRRGADRRQPTVGGVLAQRALANAGIGAEAGRAGAAGQEEAVELALADGGERRVGVQRDAAASGDVRAAVGQGGSGDIDAGAPQQVEGGDRFYFLKTLREDCENRGHGLKLKGMTADAHGNLSGKRLVVFGCGYVGGELARQARRRGLTVAALTRNPAKAAALRADGITAIEADLAGETWHPLLPDGADFVVNCVSSGGAGVAGYRHSYVDGMRSILTWAQRQRQPVQTMVYTSSTSVYPQGGGARVDEDAPTAEAGETGRILLEAETLLRDASPARRRAFVLRLAGIYGPGRHRLLDQVRTGEVSGRAQDHLNLIHRDDICAAIWRTLTAPSAHDGGTFNVADNAAATRDEITRWLAERLGVPPPRFSEAPPSGRRTTTPDRIIANDRLKRELGWAPAFPSFREGYAAMLLASEAK